MYKIHKDNFCKHSYNSKKFIQILALDRKRGQFVIFYFFSGFDKRTSCFVLAFNTVHRPAQLVDKVLLQKLF